jgi:transposase
MNYTGIDWHKKYSVCYTVDEKGNRLAEKKIENSTPAGFADYFRTLPGPTTVVHEACWNWGKLYDWLEEMEEVEEVVLAHPHKTRLIADAQIKTDRLDAKALATLLRGNLIARVHIPGVENRARKNLLRQRLSWARLRTMIRNRVHALVDRQRDLPLPQCSDLFGVKGMAALRAAQLPEPDHRLLQDDVELLDLLKVQIKRLEAQIEAGQESSPMACRLRTLPGMGKILASVAASEIDQIERFYRAEKLCAYAGLVPTTYASGGKISHGKLLPWCNKWLRWAFIEAAWVAIGCSPYFGDLYRSHRTRGKKANTAILIVARRMCQIAWTMLQDHRDFSPVKPEPKPFPGRSHKGLKVAMAT